MRANTRRQSPAWMRCWTTAPKPRGIRCTACCTRSAWPCAYEESRIPVTDAPPRDVLALLMQQHGLRQSDLSDVAPQSVISELLNGRRDFNVRHVAALSRRFGVPAEVFIPAEFTGEDDSAGARETRYLLSSPANARRLAASLAELDAGKGKSRLLVEPRERVGEKRTAYARKRRKPGAKKAAKKPA